jgi:hypothetical protein
LVRTTVCLGTRFCRSAAVCIRIFAILIQGFRAARFAENDRRLFEYRFKSRWTSGGHPPEQLVQRLAAMLGQPGQRAGEGDVIKPVRAWTADNWYFYSEGRGLKAYGTVNGAAPPQEVVQMIEDLERLPRLSKGESELRDVCLGWCFDPLSTMGYLYSNHRCFTDNHFSKKRMISTAPSPPSALSSICDAPTATGRDSGAHNPREFS